MIDVVRFEVGMILQATHAAGKMIGAARFVFGAPDFRLMPLADRLVALK